MPIFCYSCNTPCAIIVSLILGVGLYFLYDYMDSQNYSRKSSFEVMLFNPKKMDLENDPMKTVKMSSMNKLLEASLINHSKMKHLDSLNESHLEQLHFTSLNEDLTSLILLQSSPDSYRVEISRVAKSKLDSSFRINFEMEKSLINSGLVLSQKIKMTILGFDDSFKKDKMCEVKLRLDFVSKGSLEVLSLVNGNLGNGYLLGNMRSDECDFDLGFEMVNKRIKSLI